MGTVINIVLFLIILGVIVAIHELGHLIFAKKAKILCFEYAIGMGPVLYKKKNQETNFSFRAIPIGGFVSMAGEQMSTEMIKKGEIIGLNIEDDMIKDIILNKEVERQITITVTDFEIYDEEQTGNLFIEGTTETGEVVNYPISTEAYYHLNQKEQMKIAPYNRSFESKSYIQKFLTLVAGPLMNFILAIFLFFIIILFQGKPMNNNVVGGVVENTPAATAGLLKGDKIISINGKSVTDGQTLTEAVYTLTSFEDVTFIVEGKDGTTRTVKMDLMVDINQLGIANFTKDGEIKTGSSGAVLGQVFGNAVGTSKNPLLEAGDIVTKIEITKNGTPTSYTINDWYDLRSNLIDAKLNGEVVKFTILRDANEIEVEIESWEVKVLNSQGAPISSIQIGIQTQRKFNLWYSLYQPFVALWQTFKQIIQVVGFLFGGSRQIGVSDLSGPIGIFKLVEQVKSQGFLAILSFTAFLSVNIGVLNLLPIPVLDGGRIVLISIEAVTRKKIPRKVENIIINVFFILLMALMIFVAFNDIFKLFRR